jgi:hypothetical protein
LIFFYFFVFPYRMPWLYFSGICLLALASLAQTAPTLLADQARVECLYRLTHQPDSTDARMRTEFFRLRLGNKLSCFESKAQLFFDMVCQA